MRTRPLPLEHTPGAPGSDRRCQDHFKFDVWPTPVAEDTLQDFRTFVRLPLIPAAHDKQCVPWCGNRCGGFHRAWHGSKLEHFYAILHAGALCASDDVTLGHWYDEAAPGVYVAMDAHVATALVYALASHVCRDGIWWRCLFELDVRCNAQIKTSRAKQKVFPPSQVRLAAVWISPLRTRELRAGHHWVRERWEPLLESPAHDAYEARLRST